jgi:hypothetical protein
VGIRCADHVTSFYPQKLALTSPTGGGRSVGIVRSRTKVVEFSLGGDDTRWPTELWSIQGSVEGVVLQDAWRWRSDYSVVNDPLMEPGRTPLYVGLPFAWGSVDDLPPFGDSDRYK